MILEKTVELIKQIYRYHKIIPPKVTRVVVGLLYTSVEVAAYSFDPFLGLAYTLPSAINRVDCDKFELAGKVTEHSNEKLLRWTYEPPSLKKIIGIATLNAFSQHILEIRNPYKKVQGDIIDFLEIGKDTKITFIGLIKPLIQKIRTKTKSITIIEDNLSVPVSFNEFKIRNNIHELKQDEISTDILFCTGTSLINDTLEGVLALFRKESRKIVVIGPSASMIPDILFDSGVDIVGGMKIIDRESTMKVIQEGGGTKKFKKYGRKYNLIRE